MFNSQNKFLSKVFALSLLFLLPVILTAQDCNPNVVTNGDFETPDPNVCGAADGGPFGSSNQIPRPWFDQTPVDGWFGTALRIDNNISFPSPDYHNSSCTNASSIGCMGGSGSLGYWAHFIGGTAREYIQTKLNTPLEANEEYCVKVRTSTSRGFIAGGADTDKLGFWFHNNTYSSGNGFLEWNNDNGGNTFIGPGTAINAQPQLVNPAGQLITLNCQDFSYSFCPDGGEEYLVIGNFVGGAAASGGSEYISIDNLEIRKACPLTFDGAIVENGVADCAGSCIDLTATATNLAGGCEASNDFSYLWSTGDTSATINVCPTTGTTYSVDITYNAGCKSLTQTFEVTFCGPSVKLVGDTICAGETARITGTVSGTSGYTFDWSGGGITGNTATDPVSNTQTDNPTTTTTYQVIVTDDNGEKDTATVDVIVLPVPTVQFTILDDTCGNGLGSIVINSFAGTPPVSWVWSNGSTDSTLLNLVAGTYPLTISDSNCTASFNPQVNDVLLGCDSVFIPNVFTPNGDGFNDLFIIETVGVQDLSAVIYNRWGQKIVDFNQTGITASSMIQIPVWDGNTTSGTEIPDGTFYYIVEYTTSGGESDKLTGFLTLLRQ